MTTATQTPETNKQVANELLQCFSTRDVVGVLARMTDDATWQVPGKPENSPAAGIYDKARIGRLFERMFARLTGGLVMTVHAMVAEGDRVAVEASSAGDLDNGRLYRQDYHFLMQFRGGKVCAVREYLDTQHAHAVWF